MHGGLRYLEILDFRLVAEAPGERSLLSDRLAPHLGSPVPFLSPLTRHVWVRAYAGAGIALSDALGSVLGQRGKFPRHTHLTRRQALQAYLGLKRSALVGAVQCWDAQVDGASTR